jgi:hypothetical protein
MQQAATARTPVHLWIVGILATLWNCIGVADYLMTRLRNDSYFESMMPGVSPATFYAYVDAMPLYAQIGWGLGVWAGIAGSLLLLIRSKYAYHAFALSMLGIIFGIGYQIFIAPPPGTGAAMEKVIPWLVIIFGAALLYYSWKQRAKGVLR